MKLLFCLPILLFVQEALAQPVTEPATSTTRVCVAITPDVAAYAAGDVIRGTNLTTALTFSDILRSPSYSGILHSIEITNTEVDGNPFQFCLFWSNPAASTITDQGAPTIPAADLQKVKCFAPSNYKAFATSEMYWQDSIGYPVDGASEDLYGVLLATGANDWAAAQTVNVCLSVLND